MSDEAYEAFMQAHYGDPKPEPREYSVEWIVQVTDTSPLAAARQARDMHLNPTNYATVWNVRDDETPNSDFSDIDLEEDETSLTRLYEAVEEVLRVRDLDREGTASVEDLLDAIAGLDQFRQKKVK